MNWLGYCNHTGCAACHQLFVVSRGYGVFKLAREMRTLACPVCKSQDFEIRNIGFVNSEWALKGKLMNKEESKVIGEGKTYDGKMYTFKETNYLKVFETLEVMAKKIQEVKIKNDSKLYSELSSCMS